jgi:hypothetical protein
MTARRCRDDMIERSDSAERIEATLAKDPMANAEANDPMEPMDRNDPTLPTDRIEFFDLIDRIEFSDRIEHQLPWLVTNEDYGSRQRRRYSGSLRRNRGGSRSGWTPTASPRTPPKSADASDETVGREPPAPVAVQRRSPRLLLGGLR